MLHPKEVLMFSALYHDSYGIQYSPIFMADEYNPEFDMNVI